MVMSTRKLPKICALALVVLAAAGTDGETSPQQSTCNQQTNNALVYSNRSPSTLLMNSFFRDPWFDHQDLWHDPFGWGHHFRPWGLSHHPWGKGLSLLNPFVSTGRTLRAGSQRCQDDAGKIGNKLMQNNGVHQENLDPCCPRQEADNQRNALKTRDVLNEKEEQQQRMDKQRHVQKARQRMLEEQEQKQRQEEKRLEEERRWRQEKRQQEEEARRQRQLWEEEERRIKTEMREKQEREAVERQMREERAMKQKWMQEQKEAEERKRRESSWNHPSQGTKDNRRFHDGRSHQNQQQRFRRVEVASLNIPGYTPEDLSVMTSGNRLVVEGRHVCDCHEKCTEKEFKRGFEIPRNVDPSSLEAHLVQGGQLTIHGNQHSTRIHPTGDLKVSVEGDGSFPPRLRNVDSTCGGTRKGFKLKKMNKRTGQIVEDAENLVREMHGRTFEDEVEEDGVTMEVEY